jgi:hypothetical protein
MVFGSWFVRGGILRVAQNDKGDGEAFLPAFCVRSTEIGAPRSVKDRVVTLQCMWADLPTRGILIASKLCSAPTLSLPGCQALIGSNLGLDNAIARLYHDTALWGAI